MPEDRKAMLNSRCMIPEQTVMCSPAFSYSTCMYVYTQDDEGMLRYIPAADRVSFSSYGLPASWLSGIAYMAKV